MECNFLPYRKRAQKSRAMWNNKNTKTLKLRNWWKMKFPGMGTTFILASSVACFNGMKILKMDLWNKPRHSWYKTMETF